MTVGLQTGEEDVKKPEAEKEGCCRQSVSPGPAQFSSDVGPAPVKQHRDGQEGEDGEESDREGQRAGFHHKRLPLDVPVDGRHRPGHADSQEDVDGVAASHIPDGGVRVGVLDCWYLTGKGVCGGRGYLSFPVNFDQIISNVDDQTISPKGQNFSKKHIYNLVVRGCSIICCYPLYAEQRRTGWASPSDQDCCSFVGINEIYHVSASRRIEQGLF